MKKDEYITINWEHYITIFVAVLMCLIGITIILSGKWVLDNLFINSIFTYSLGILLMVASVLIIITSVWPKPITRNRVLWLGKDDLIIRDIHNGIYIEYDNVGLLQGSWLMKKIEKGKKFKFCYGLYKDGTNATKGFVR